MGIIIPHDSLEDTNLRYSHCYGKYKDKLIYIDRVRDRREDGVLIRGAEFKGGLWENYSEQWFDDSALDMSSIHLGYVDVGNAARLVSRSHGSSYRLGICNQRYNISSAAYDALSSLGYRASPKLGAIVPLMYNPKYKEVDKCISLIMNKQMISSAFSPLFAVGLSFKVHMLGMYRNNSLIGEIDPNTCEVTLPYKHRYFADELNEMKFETTLREDKK